VRPDAPLTDDSGSRESQQSGRNGAGVAVIAIVVGDQNGYGRMTDDRTEEQLESPGNVFGEPVCGYRLCGLRGHTSSLAMGKTHSLDELPGGFALELSSTPNRPIAECDAILRLRSLRAGDYWLTNMVRCRPALRIAATMHALAQRRSRCSEDAYV
jgi:hypothetical protein